MLAGSALTASVQCQTRRRFFLFRYRAFAHFLTFKPRCKICWSGICPISGLNLERNCTCQGVLEQRKTLLTHLRQTYRTGIRKHVKTGGQCSRSSWRIRKTSDTMSWAVKRFVLGTRSRASAIYLKGLAQNMLRKTGFAKMGRTTSLI